MIVQTAVDYEGEIIPLLEQEEIVVGNMSFSLRDYAYAVASDSDVIYLAEATYRTVMRSPDGRVHETRDA